MTLTDIATGWTECVPVLNRSPETVLAAIKHARQCFPFPLLGLDTDNGSEFLNTILLSYCQQEQLTFTCSRPECSNDNCHIEQKNRAVVRKIVGHDRLVSMLAYQQLGELYQAARLLVNCFQPSMKLQSKQIEGEHERRIYDEAKTPLQRMLLSGVLSDEIQRQWRETIESLDPLRLVQHVEALQRAVWRCAEGGPGTMWVRFSLSACVSAAARPAQREPPGVLLQGFSHPAELRDWSRSMDDPFLEEWEQIHAYVRARPMASAGEILREWQRRFPERFIDAHLGILQRRLREIRAHLLASHAASSVGEKNGAIASRTLSESTQAPEDVSPLADVSATVPPDATSTQSFLQPAPKEETRPAHRPLAATSEASSSKEEEEGQHAPTIQASSATSNADVLRVAAMTVDHAISLFLQGEHTYGWEPKTREWHETSLGQLQRYLAWRRVILLSSLTGNEIRGWLTFLRTEALVTEAFRVQSTISTYARSVHAFCVWLVGRGHLAQSPFAGMPFPKGKKRRLRMIDQKTFEHFLEACHAPHTKQATMAYATARNRVILWILWDTGLLVSEVCALNLGDVDLAQGALRVQGSGSRGR